MWGVRLGDYFGYCQRINNGMIKLDKIMIGQIMIALFFIIKTANLIFVVLFFS